MSDLRTLRPAALAGTVNDYTPTSFGIEINRILQDCSVDSTITGLLALTDGTYIILQNISGSKTLTLTHEDVASAAANRFLTPGEISLVLTPGGSALLDYDSVSVRWRVIATGTTGGGGGGAPTDAEYVVGAMNGSLSAERLLTDTASITWDLATANQAKANVTAESVQDAVGAILADTATIDLTYDDATPAITAVVKDGSVTYAKIQDVSATDRFLGRKTAGAGDVEELTGAEATARLDAFTDALKGLAPASGGGTTNFLRADATWAAPPGGGGAPTDAEYLVGAANGSLTAERVVTDTATVAWDLGTAAQAKANVPNDAITYAKMQNVSAGDRVLGRVTGAGDVEEIVMTAAGRALVDDATAGDQRTTLGLGALATKASIATGDIDADAVTYAKMQNVSATDRFLGRKTAGAGDVEELTGTEATARLDTFTSALKGLAPASGGGTSNFLRADGAWSAPSGAGGAALSRLALAAAGSGAAGADMTWVVLTGDSTFQNVLTTIMTLTGVGTGTWHARLVIRYQSSATTTGIGFACDHTGTVAFWLSDWFHITTGGAAATGIGDQVAAVNAGQMAEGKSERAKNTVSSSSAGVDTLNADMLAVMDILFEVTATGSFVFKAQAETANNVTVKAGTIIELCKIA